MSKKTYTVEQAQTIGKGLLTAVKTYGNMSGLVEWAAGEDTLASLSVLAAAIKVAVDMKTTTDAEKKVRKSALDVWTNTLKRVRKGEKTAGKGEQDMRPLLAYTRDDGKVTVYWKTPEPKADKGGEGDGEEQGETGGTPGELTNAELLALVQARIEADAEFASQVEEMVAALIG